MRGFLRQADNKVPGGFADMPVMQERRLEPRMLCADMVEVLWQQERGRPCRAVALLEDIAPSGACLQMETAVPTGAWIRWGCSGHEFTGRVRYCVYREIGYFVGVQFESGSKWSEESFKPQHLLDLKSLIERAG